MEAAVRRTIIFAKLAEHVANDVHLPCGDGRLVAIELPDNFILVGGSTTVPEVLDAAIAWRKANSFDSLSALANAIDDLIAERGE